MAIRALGGVVRCTFLLIFVCIIAATSVGCRAPAPAVVKRCYVRLQMLLPLHPAWRQVLMLREEAAQFTTAQARPDRVILDLPALPSNFTPPQAVPLSRVNERQQRMAEEALRRVTRDAQQLKADNDTTVLSEEQAARAGARATYQRELSERIAAIRQQRDAEAAVLQRRIDRLGFRVVALQTQVNAYGDRASQARDDALLQRDRLNAEIADLDAQRTQKLNNDSILAEANATMADVLKQLNQVVEGRLAARRRQLNQETEDKIAQFRDRLAQRRDLLPTIGGTPSPPQYPHETPLPFPTRQETVQAIRNAQTTVDRETAREQGRWKVQQERLIDLIRADTQQAVNQIARERGWTLVSEGAPGATDVTAAAAAAISTQWQGIGSSNRFESKNRFESNNR